MEPHQSEQLDQQLYPFSEAELARLSVYRSAVASGFYSDSCDAAVDASEDEFVLDWLNTDRVAGYPFSRRELQRMATYKLAVAIGLYTDGREGGYATEPQNGP